MNATRELPEGYRLAGEIDLSRNLRLMALVNALGLLMLVIGIALFTALLVALRPVDAPRVLAVRVAGVLDLLVILVALLGVTILMAVVHEAIHGVFFRWVAGVKPRYGLRGMYAFAAAPEWYIPRGRYLLVGLAPLVIISVVGVALMTVLPVSLLRWLYLLLIFNFSGAVGDMLVVAWLLRKPAASLAQDYGDGVRVYVPGAG